MSVQQPVFVFRDRVFRINPRLASKRIAMSFLDASPTVGVFTISVAIEQARQDGLGNSPGSLCREAVNPAGSSARSGIGAAAILMRRVPDGISPGRIALRPQAVGVTHLCLLV